LSAVVPRRPPRFALVLSALIAGVGIAVLVADTGSSPPAQTTQPTVGLGPSHICLQAPAEAQVTAQSEIVITANEEAPVSATERAIGPNGTASVTKQALESARLRVSEPVSVKRVAKARAGACANADSSTAAHDLALRKASTVALASAHAAAARSAQTALRALMRRLYPAVLQRARAEAAVHARQLAHRALPALEAQAAAAARRQAGS
jgi:hypothetical protein